MINDVHIHIYPVLCPKLTLIHPREVSGRGGPAVRPAAADFPRDVCLTVSRNHAIFLLYRWYIFRLLFHISSITKTLCCLSQIESTTNGPTSWLLKLLSYECCPHKYLVWSFKHFIQSWVQSVGLSIIEILIEWYSFLGDITWYKFAHFAITIKIVTHSQHVG